MTKKSFLDSHYPPLFAAAAAGLMSLAGTSRHGPGLSMDYAAYVAAARGLLSGHGFVSYDGGPLVLWPPLYPTLLALPGIFGIDPAVATQFVSAFLSGAVIYVSGLWLRKNIESPALRLASLAIVTLSYPLLQVSVFGLSEPLFILLLLLFLLTMERYLRGGGTVTLAAAAALAALACLTRYAGPSVVLTGVILLLLRKDARWPRRIADTIMFGLISTVPVAAWLARNYLASGSLMGERGPSSYTLMENVTFTLDIVSAWAFPPSISPYVRVSLLLWLLTLLLVNLRRRGADLAPVKAPAVFLLVYVGYLIAITTSVALHRIDDRLMSPTYVPFVLTVSLCMDRLRQPRPAGEGRGKPLGATLAVVLGVWLVSSGYRCIAADVEYARYGPGIYSADAWQHSGLLSYLKEAPPRGRVYSNAPHALYIFAGVPARQSPRKYLHPNTPGTPTDDIERFKSALTSGGETYLVWFDMQWSEDLYGVRDLMRICHLKALMSAPEGTLYLVGGNGR